MVKVARRTKRIMQTGSQQRSDAKFLRAAEYVRNGRLGRIKRVLVGLTGVNYAERAKPLVTPDSAPPSELDYEFWLGPAPWRPYNRNRVHYLFRFFWDYSGGQMTNWGAHHLDIAQWGLGMDGSGPVEIEGKARHHKDGWYEVPQWSEIVYRYANGVTVICGMDQKMGTTFEGEAGTLYVNRGKLESTPSEIIEKPITERDVRLYRSGNHHKNWYECIKTRRTPICDVEIGHRTATVCHLGNLALRLGRKIRWDPETEKIVGDAEAAKRMQYDYRSPWRLKV
jgi:predicted dehydrogenase